MRIMVGGIMFGRVEDGVAVVAFDRVGAVSAARQQVPFSDVTYPGTDWLSAELWTFTLRAKDEGVPAAVAASNALEAVWRNPVHRAPGVLVALDYDATDGGQWKRVYGRLGRFAGVAPDPAVSHVGAGTILAEFEVLDPRHYGSVVRSQTIGLVSESTGGFIFPLAFPATSTISGSSSTSRFIDVGGDAPTPLAVTFHGDLTDPLITVDGQEVGLSGHVAADLPVTIDARTQTVTRADGASMPGRLTRRTRLDHLLVHPGRHEVAFGGVSSSGTGSVTIAWRDATWGL